jgi:hypothetical protein
MCGFSVRDLSPLVLLLAACGYNPKLHFEGDAGGGQGGIVGGPSADGAPGTTGQDTGFDGLSRDAADARDGSATDGIRASGGATADGGAGGSGGSTLTGTGGALGGSSGSGGIGGNTGGGGGSAEGGTSGAGGVIIRNDAGPDVGDSGFTDVPILVRCPLPVDPTNGGVKVTSLEVGGTATYSCTTGYGPPNPPTRTCLAEGTWSGVAPTCDLVDCHAPPAISHGNVSAAVTTYGAAADYSCVSGYTLSGVTQRQCQADGTWSGVAPTCTLVDCHAPPTIDHGSVSAPITTYGAAADYSCAPTYALSGTGRRYCQEDGTWSGTEPSCVLQTAKLTITKTGTGTVTSSPAGIDCGATCQASFALGTSIVLTATPGASQSFVGWDSTVCAGKGTCTFSLAADTEVQALFTPPPNILFVTSTTHDGNLGGLVGADNICMTRAQAGGLSGTYRAWLSTSTVNARDRLGSARGWVRPDGKPVLNRVEDIAENKLFYPPRLDESGVDLGTVGVWTDTSAAGVLTTEPNTTTCGDFTSATVDPTKFVVVGSSSRGGSLFTTWAGYGCTMEQHLYCFGIDRTAIVSVDPVATGRLAFTTSVFWRPDGGIASADALCQSEATAAGLPGTYKALLATNGNSAASRFSTSGAPWIRPDGIPLAPTASGLFAAAFLDAPPNMTANGAQRFDNQTTWSGARTMTTVGTSDTTCINWQSSTSTTFGSFLGAAGDSDASLFFGGVGGDCTVSARLVCLQE